MAQDEVKGCRICLTTDCKLYSMIKYNILYMAYENLSGLMINNEEPLYLCPDCTGQLLVCAHFRRIIRKAHSTLMENVKDHSSVTLELLKLSRTKLGSNEIQSGYQNDDDLEAKLNEQQNAHLAEQTEEKNLSEEPRAITFIKVERTDGDDDHNNMINNFNELGCNDGKVCIDIPPEDMYVKNVGSNYSVVIKQEINNEETSNDSDNMDRHFLAKDEVVNRIKVEKTHEENSSNINEGTVCVAWREVNRTNDGRIAKNYGMIQESGCGKSVNANVEFKGEIQDADDSSNDSLPLAETRRRTELNCDLDVKKLPNDTARTKSAVRNDPASCRYVTNYKHSCDICAFATNSDVRWSCHMKAHYATESFNCDICNYITTSKGRLLGHYKVHNGEKPYACDMCDMYFNRKHNLDVHYRKHFAVKPFRCDVCQKTFTEKRILEDHERTHSGERPFPCTVCDKSFANKNSLRKHLHVHSDFKPFKCDVCSKTFTAKTYVRIHMRLHSGEKPFTCSVCNKVFNRKHHLKQHMSGHTGDKPYACDICDKAFVDRSRLRIHTRLHSDEKPFSCDYCEKTFKTKGNAKSHMLRHLQNKLL